MNDAVERRLKEELGIECLLKKEGQFTYKATDEVSGLTEHEFDFIFIGKYSEEIPFNKKEVESVRWVSKENLKNELKKNPSRFTPWFKEILPHINW